jgi:tetratricopeptide (TPR) repeat protein
VSRRPLAALVVLLLVACRGQTGGSGGGASAPDPLAEARQFLEQGQADAALARLQGASDPEALFLQGRAWAKKAETAPLPTPPALASPLPRGAAAPAAPEFKFEELQAIDCYERAVAAKPELAAAHLALADLLGPHALARRPEEAATASRRPRRGTAPEPVAAAPAGPDASPERILREYRLAAQADPSDKAAVDSWVLFATSVGRVGDADAAFQELLKREKEKPEPFVRYGDFLLASKQDAMGAIAQYSQALIWKPDDEAVKAKIADIYLGIAADHLAHQQYATGEARLKDAQKYISNRASAQGMRLQDLQQQVAQIRGRPVGR